MRIITLTLNPAYDLHCFAETFLPYRENLFSVIARDAGGKGINVSRALLQNGVQSTAVCVVGRENGAEFLQRLAGEGIAVSAVEVEGRIRENITLHEKSKPETRISFEGFSMEEKVLLEVRRAIGTLCAGDICVLAGSAPAGITEQALVAFLLGIKEKGAALVIDSRSVSLSSMGALRPMLIKPNKDEAEKALGIEIHNLEQAKRAAEQLRESGIENVLLSLGAKGAVLASASGTFYAKVPRITPVSTIGAGDSTLAGFLCAKREGLSPARCLEKAAAFGSAACLTEGTAPPRAKDIAKLLEKIRAEAL